MKLRIEGKDYDVAEIGRLSLLDLLELKKQTGMDVDRLQEVFAEAQQRQDEAPDDEEGAMSILGTEDGLIAFGALIWLSRRKAGERSLTFEQACDFPLEELQFVDDEPGEVEPPDPR
jgi:hypothetical protein